MDAPTPPARQTAYLYVILDRRTSPPTPVGVALTRKQAREVVQWHEDADHLRIRRARAVIYES